MKPWAVFFEQCKSLLRCVVQASPPGPDILQDAGRGRCATWKSVGIDGK
jgi:hypothetical protein